MSRHSDFQRPRHWACGRPLAVVICLVITGCAAPDPSTSDNDTTVATSDLFLGQNVTLWPNHTVPVCYVNNVPNAAALAQSVRTILDTFGWSAVANVTFTGWGACNSGGNNGTLNLSFISTGGGGTSPFGYPGANAQAKTSLTLPSNGALFTLPNGGLLHEFGHVLGFQHEQDRPDNVLSDGTGRYCPETTGGTGGLVLTPYVDTQSVMNYCSQSALSAGDVAGVQSVYGVGGLNSMWQGQNSSTNAVARTPNNLDTFIARDDGSVWINSWYNTPGWPYPWPESQVASGGMPNSPIAATARTPSNMDVFFASVDGAIHTAAWSNGSAWSDLGDLPGTQGLVEPGEQVAAVASTPGTIDVFFAGTDGSLYWSHWWYTGGWFGNPVPIISDGSVPVGAAVSAVARTPDHLDVFFVDTNGVPHSAYCYGSSGPGACYVASHLTSGAVGQNPPQASNWPSFPIPTSSSCTAVPGGGMAAAARSANNIDLFYVNSSGTMCTSYWNSGASWGTPAAPNSYPFGIRGVANPRALVSVVARSPNNLDAFFVGIDGGLYNAWWNTGSTNGVQDFEVSGSGLGPGLARNGSAVGVTGRTPNNLDVFPAGDHGVTTAYWSSGAPWAGYSVESPIWFTSELSIDNHSPGVNAGINLSVTVNQDVGPTPYYIWIVDATTSQLIGECGGGTTCTATQMSSAAATHMFRAYISGWSASLPLPAIISATGPQFATWSTSGYTLQLAPDPLVLSGASSGTVTATSSVDVGPTPYFITLYDADSGEILASCGFGTTCQATVSLDTQHVVALTDNYASALSSPQAQASSNTLSVNPG